MEMGIATGMTEVDPALRADARWQLIERIIASPPFQKSARLRDLLCFLAERTLHGQTQDLSEHRIGSAVFGKAHDYSVVEDSSVRVHVRQLRLKLHEYFDGEGRGETQIVEIPKGAYTTLFRPIEQRAAAIPVLAAARNGLKFWLQLMPWALAALFFATTLVSWFRHPEVSAPVAPPWPLAALFESGSGPVQVVVADINYGMLRLIDEQPVTLDQYLSPSYRSGVSLSNAHPTAREARVMKYLSGSLLTSYADLVVVDTLMRLSGNSSARLAIRSARELRPRDLEQGTFVFVGSPSSNPWVSYFQDKLSFQEREGVVGESLKFFQSSSRIYIRNPESKQLTRVWFLPEVQARITRPFRFCLWPMAEAACSSCKDCNRREPKLPAFFWPMPATGKSFRRHLALPDHQTSLSTSKPSSAPRLSRALPTQLPSLQRGLSIPEPQ
jgi:hypothetical protein